LVLSQTTAREICGYPQRQLSLQTVRVIVIVVFIVAPLKGVSAITSLLSALAVLVALIQGPECGLPELLLISGLMQTAFT
jgi:hypothetical protein